MCGIYFSTRFYSDELVRKKMERIRFRGPDFSKFIRLDERIIMGHNRLSIIDLDERSHQPFQYEHLHIVFNGEIYNYRILKHELEQQGFQFRTNSDTEVICALFIKYGKGCLNLLNGMFAFVIYDSKTKQIFGARDRFGKKPFYYSLQSGALECASQPSQIAMGNQLAISEKAVQAFFTYRYIPEPLCIYEGIQKLKAGHFFTYDIEKQEWKTECYYFLPAETANYKGTYQDALKELDALLKDAIQIRMIADVPLGCFLSGGIDSSTVAALAANNSSMPIKTFSVKFDVPEYDESPYATETAAYLKTNHTNIPCSINDGISIIENLHQYYDEPFADSSAIPSVLLANATKSRVTVALSGDGGDEGFIGYNFYDWINKANSVFKIPVWIRQPFAAALCSMPHDKLQKIGEKLRQKSIDDFIMNVYRLNPEYRSIADSNPMFETDCLSGNKNFLQKASDYNIKFWLPNDSNVKVDRASMSAALEVRSPFLDYRVIEFARSLPIEFRYQPGQKKKILKDLLYQYAPKELFNRPKKGFGVPMDKWFRNEMKHYVNDLLTKENLEQIGGLKTDVIQRKLKEHQSGQYNHAAIIWNLVVMINWIKQNNG